MGELIAFKLPRNAARLPRVRREPAEILFFMGVRREIPAEPDAARKGEQPGKRGKN